MKINSGYSSGMVIILALFISRISAQSVSSCCSKTSTAAFAMLSHDESFKASHAAPLPFHYDSPKGKMVEIKARDGKTVAAFEVKADKPTNNYLFVIHEWWGLNDYIKQEAEKLQNILMNV
ncbi:MAG: dienelactone hydrolase family protein, partial [Bacteroidia bacterium]